MPAKPRPIPEGFTTVTPHLVIKEAAAAIEFYKKAFGAIEQTRMAAPDGKGVLHCQLKIGNAVLMLCDEFPDMGPQACRSPQSLGGTTFTVHLFVDDVDMWFKRAVDAGAKVIMPLMDMFWGDRYGKLVDPFGHQWSLAMHNRDLTPQQMQEEMFAMMGKMAKR